jgi:hypothetical protein
MDLEAVSLEIGTTLGSIAGLRVPAWGVEKISPPAAIVALPERIEYLTYGRGVDNYPDLPVVILVGVTNVRTARKQLAAYAAGSGASSVKAVLFAHAWVACDSVRVSYAEFDNAKYAGTDYLAVIFHLDIVGRGA